MKHRLLPWIAACALLGLQGCEMREVTIVTPPQTSETTQPSQPSQQAQLPPPAAAPQVNAVPDQQPPAPVDPQVAVGAAPAASAAQDQGPAAALPPPPTSEMGAQPAGPQGSAAVTEMGEFMTGREAVKAGLAEPGAPSATTSGAAQPPAQGASAPRAAAPPPPGEPSARLPAVRDAGDPEGARLLAQRPLLVPVAGVQPDSLTDQFELARGRRVHEAIDIVAPRGTPVVAVDEGRVAKLFSSRAGGLTVYQFDPGQRLAYYYAHLDRYAGGLREGMDLRRGDVIGYVGSSGNASANVPHLHFAVFRLGNPPRWWEGEAVNPYPALSRATPAQQLASS